MTLLRAIHLGTCMVLLAASLSAARRPRLWAGAWVLALVSGVLWFWRALVEMNGGDPVTPAVLQAGLATHFGGLWLGRMALAAVLPGLGKGRAVGAVGLLGSLAWAGHAGAAPHAMATLTLWADVVHLLLGGLWPAGLLTLYLALRDPAAADAALDEARRTSAVSLFAVAGLLGTGTINAWALVGRWSALYGTDYGRLLLVKLALLLMMLAFGAANFRHVRRPAVGTLVRLRRNVGIELLLAIGLLVVIGAMGHTAPPSMEPGSP